VPRIPFGVFRPKAQARQGILGLKLPQSGAVASPASVEHMGIFGESILAKKKRAGRQQMLAANLGGRQDVRLS
jgi:hypothetical protein